MKAKSFQINALSNQIKNGFDVVLLYGTDPGEMDYTLAQLKKELGITPKETNLCILSKDELKKRPFAATDEANTLSLMSERRFVLIQEDTSFSVQALSDFLQNKQTDALLIIQGGNLTKSNALRLEAEKNPRILAIACYTPTLADIQKMVSGFLTLHHKKITPALLMDICKKIPYNQQVIEKELDKLLLYLGDQQEVDEQAIQSCLTNNADISLENLCIDLADGNTENVQNNISLFLESDETETTLLWSVRDYFERLLLIVSDTSEPLPQVIKKNLRPAQFRLEMPLARQARVWTPKHILTFLNKLSQLERRTRTTGFPKEIVISQAFLSLAQFAKSLTRMR